MHRLRQQRQSSYFHPPGELIARRYTKTRERTTERVRRSVPNEHAPHERPQTRADCVNGMRPCPFVGCRHHLFLNVRPSGNIAYPFGADIDALHEMPATCALDVADDGEHKLDELGPYLNVSGTLVGMLCQRAVKKMEQACGGKSDEQQPED